MLSVFDVTTIRRDCLAEELAFSTPEGGEFMKTLVEYYPSLCYIFKQIWN